MQKTHPRLRDAEWLTDRYETQRKTVAEMAVELGVSTATIGRAMKRHNIAVRSPQESRLTRGTIRRSAFPQLLDSMWLRDRYSKEEMSTEEIGAAIGCSSALVLRALTRNGIERRTPGVLRAGRRRSDIIPELRDLDWLRREYIERRRSPAEIAAQLNCSALTVISMLSRYGVRRRNPTTSPEGLPRTMYKDGYVMVWSPDHPQARASGYVGEHRLVAERAIGRMLTASEVVHHLNLRRDDNRPDNLLVFASNAQHSSFHQRPPSWVPRCECCGHVLHERIERRPEDVPMLWRT